MEEVKRGLVLYDIPRAAASARRPINSDTLAACEASASFSSRCWPSACSPRGRRSCARCRPYRILVTNDDGVHAPGIAAIAQILPGHRRRDDRRARAEPERQGHSIVTSEPVFREDLTLPNGLRAIGLTRDAGDHRQHRHPQHPDAASRPGRLGHQSRLQPRVLGVPVGDGGRRARGGDARRPGDCRVAGRGGRAARIHLCGRRSVRRRAPREAVRPAGRTRSST